MLWVYRYVDGPDGRSVGRTGTDSFTLDTRVAEAPARPHTGDSALQADQTRIPQTWCSVPARCWRLRGGLDVSKRDSGLAPD